MNILSEDGESLSREKFLGQFTGEIMREYFTLALEEPEAVLLIQIGKFYETMQMGIFCTHILSEGRATGVSNHKPL